MPVADEVAEWVFIDMAVWTRRELDGQPIYLGTARFRRAATLFNHGRPDMEKGFQRYPVTAAMPQFNGPEGTQFWAQLTIGPDVTTNVPLRIGEDT